jgi:putative endonuclease
MMPEYYVYILQSRQNYSFYKGSTNDLARRLSEHNDGKEFSTARYLPWDLVWFTRKPSRSEAMVLERKLKNLSVIRTIGFITAHPVLNLEGGPDVAPLRQSGC